MPETLTFAVVVVAAGASSRLGKPKQLLLYKGETLLRHAAKAAIESGASDVVVVLGFDAVAMLSELGGVPVRTVVNEEWPEGMGSSIRHGIDALGSQVKCAVVMLGDQPYVTPQHICSLASRHFDGGAPIVASLYDNVRGVPCAFGSEVFPELLALTGDSGAKELIRAASAKVDTVPFFGGSLDIDTQEDYDRLSDG